MSSNPDRYPLAVLLGSISVVVGLLAASVVVDGIAGDMGGLASTSLYSLALLGLGGWLVWIGLGGRSRSSDTGGRIRSRRGLRLLQLGAGVLLGVPLLSVSVVSEACACGGVAHRLQWDLQTLASAQEFYYNDGNYAFASSLDELTDARDRPVEPSDGVRLTILEATSGGWAAEAVSQTVPEMRCVVYLGDVEERPSTFEGEVPASPLEVVCDASRRRFEIGMIPGGGIWTF